MHILIVPTCLWVVFFFKIIYNIVPVFINCLLHVGLVPTEVLCVYFVNNSLNFLYHKVSGTASKLGKHNTFHHFTLLHDVNVENLEMALESPMKVKIVRFKTVNNPQELFFSSWDGAPQ